MKKIAFIIVPLLIIGIAICAWVALSQEPPLPPQNYEITEVDIFSLPSFRAMDILVKGVRLGDSFDTVVAALGQPDTQSVVKSGTINLEYGKNMQLSDTGLIIQLKNDVVVGFTFKQSFNPLLIGKTKIIHSKEEIYLDVLGKPDNIYFIPLTPTSAQAYKVLEYKEKGLYVLLRKDEENGFAIRSIPLKE